MFGPRALYFDIARLTVRALTRTRRSGNRLSSTTRPILPTRSMAVPAMTPAACTTWSRAALSATVKLARSGSTSGRVAVASAIAVRRTVGDQQGICLLLDTGRSAGAQHPTTHDARLEFEVAGFDLPPLV